MTLIQAIARIMRIEGIIRGDTDAPTSLSDLQHGATINQAAIAVQDELIEIASDVMLPYEKNTTGSIATISGTRSYSLAADFVRFVGTPMLYCTADNFEMFEFPGGEERLKLEVPNYRTVQSDPFAFYFEYGTTKKISFYQVPQSVKTYVYDYEKDISVTAATDTLPFHNEIEAQAFCRVAARRFKYIYQGLDIKDLDADTERQKAKTVLFDLVVGKNAPRHYAPVYR
jgi:hypothetical protein